MNARLTSVSVTAAIVFGIVASAAELVRPSPGEATTYDISAVVRSTNGNEVRVTKGNAEARLFCLSDDTTGNRSAIVCRTTGAITDNAFKGSLAFVSLDAAGRVQPDLPMGSKISLDPSSWTVVGMLPRLPADRFGKDGRWTELVDVQVYGEAQQLALYHTLTRSGETWILTRRPAEPNVRLKIGRKMQPLLREFSDRWVLDAAGRTREWTHRTSVDFPAPGEPARAVVLDLSVRRLETRKLSSSEAAALASDVARTKPVWAALVNPEPTQLSLLSVTDLRRSLDDFLKTRASASPLGAGARLLRDNFGQLELQVQGIKSEELESRKLIGKSAPDFTLNDPAGKPMKLSDSRGKVTLLVFWGMGCRLCRTEAPLLTELFDKYKNRGFSVVAVECFDNDSADIRTYISEQKLRHPVVIKGATIAESKYFVGGLPRAFWIDATGRVVGRETGFDSKKVLEDKIEELLRNK